MWASRALVLALVAACLMAIFGDRGPSTDPGTVVDGMVSNITKVGSYEPTVDQEWRTRLPYGQVRVSTSVGRAVQINDKEHELDGPARWVEVEWTPEPTFADDSPVWPGATLRERQEPGTDLVLVSGGRRYPIAEGVVSSSGGGSLVIAVADAKDLHILTKSGKRQVRATEGRPDGNRDRGVETDCGEAGESNGVVTSIGCELNASRNAYVPGLGWAPRGQDWVVVSEASAAPDGERDGTPTVATWKPDDEYPGVDYRPSGTASLTLTVSGASSPTKRVGKVVSSKTGVRLETRAYLVPSGEEARVDLTYRTVAVPQGAEPDDSDDRKRLRAKAPRSVTVTDGASLTLPPWSPS